MYSKETQKQVRQLYVVKGKKLPEISQITGVNLRTLQHWSVTKHWRALRIEFEEKMEGTEFEQAELYKIMLVKAVDTLDPKDIEAALKLKESLFNKEFIGDLQRLK